MVTREANGTIYTHAGPEIGVASTKAFTAQLTALFLFALYLAQRARCASATTRRACYIGELGTIPGKLESVLAHGRRVPKTWPRNTIARRISSSSDAAFTTRSRWKARSS